MPKKHICSNTVLFILIIFSFNLNLTAQLRKQFFELAAANNYALLNFNNYKTNFNLWSDIESGLDDFGNFFSSPLHFSKNTWLKIGTVTAITGGLFFADKTIRSSVKKIHTNFQDNLIKIGDQYGKGIVPAGLSLALYGFGFLTNNYELKSTGQILFESLAAAGITVTAIKVIFGRSRPYMGQGQYQFNFFKTDNDFNSFPSGHTIIAFTTSAVLAEKIDNLYASLALYSLASLTAYQRIYTDNHWFSDTFFAAVLGVVIGKYFVHLNKGRNKKSDSGISQLIVPYTDFKNTGIRLTIIF